MTLDQAHFPDEYFLEIISDGYDADMDGILSAEKICGITELDIECHAKKEGISF